MKQLLFFLILYSTSLQSQNFTKVDDIVSEYPKISKAEDLATQISKDFTSDKEKARAVFYWLSNNIRYNLKEYYNPKQRSYNFSYSSEEEKIQKLKALKDQLVSEVFRTKMGVCEDYAQAFKKVCDLLNLKSEVIVGNVRSNYLEIGKKDSETNHAWNAIKLNNKWIILDATWAAGYEINGKWVPEFEDYYYDIPKEKIFKTHLPKASNWILPFGKITLEEFYDQPIYSKSLLNSTTELLTPKNGIITVNSSKEIKLKFKNLDSSSNIYYVFKGQRYSKKPLISIEKNITAVTIKNALSNTYLHIFFDKEPALHYKVK